MAQTDTQKALAVHLGPNSYEILLAPGALDNAGALIKPVCTGEKAFVLTDQTVGALYGKRATQALERAGFSVSVCALPSGEQTKDFQTLPQVYRALLEAGITRKDLLVALGGGVIGDLGGFAAATYLRGIPFVQMPTTLLAQVDSSVGGKVGVDLAQGKNLVGAFYQPKRVIIDPGCLETLTDRVFADGMAEVIKYGCILDQGLFQSLEQWHSRSLLKPHMAEIVAKCCTLKKTLVEQDEKDTGQRMLLNFGHTIGHAIEACQHYQGFTHGEAVAIGMVEMTERTERKGITQRGTAARIEALLQQFGLPTHNQTVPLSELAKAMRHDKKNLGQNLKIVALEQIGKAGLVDTDLSCLEW